MRRQLTFEQLNQAIAACESLLETGYQQTGNWSLAQICHHIRISIESNMNGYPAWMTMLGFPLRPLLRWLALPRVLSGNSPSGVRTARMFVPPENLDDRAEVAALAGCVTSFLESNASLHPHPGFGKMKRDEFNRFHAAHIAHHLSFLVPHKSTAETV